MYIPKEHKYRTNILSKDLSPGSRVKVEDTEDGDGSPKPQIKSGAKLLGRESGSKRNLFAFKGALKSMLRRGSTPFGASPFDGKTRNEDI
jgi:hypothetical protein